MERRLVDLEVRYTYLDRQIAELSQVVFEQQKVIESLQQQLAVFRARLGESLEPSVREAPADERPPHY